MLAFAAVAAGEPQEYPSAPVRVIVPFTPGTGADTIARVMQPQLAKRLGQAIVVDNRPGASGTIGEDQVAKAPPDGYTVLMAADSMVMATQLYRNVPFHPVNDLRPVSMAARGTLMLVANPKAGIKSLADLLAQAKARPGAIAYGSPGVGTPHHMAMELLKSESGVNLLHVPYKGTSGFTQDLVAGQVQVGFLPVHVAQGFVRDGKLVALAVGGHKRHAAAPGVPTLAELGHPPDIDMWFGYYVPARTPDAIVHRLHDAIALALQAPEVKTVLARAGLEAESSSPEALREMTQGDYARWGEVIRRNGISAD